jgi:DNA-binding transcriptional LysR family regulator
MERFDALKAFILVAEEGGFSRAAAELGVSKSAASRQISSLEQELGVALFSRTTRRVELTEAGQAYLVRVKPILAELDAANRDVARPESTLSGPLRIAAPVALGTSRLAPIVARFMIRYPQIAADVVLIDRFVDASEEGFDLVLSLENPALETTGLRLLPLETGLVASPDYIASHGRPQAPGDLSQHPALCLGARGRHVSWHLRGQIDPVQVIPRMTSNQAGVIREAALAGLGIALLPGFLVAEDVRAGRLQRLLDGFEPKPDWLCAQYPQGGVVSPKIRLFTDFLVEQLQRDGF